MAQGYEHIDDAAAAALYALGQMPHVARQEYMGLLLRDPQTGLIHTTDLQTDKQRDASSYRGPLNGRKIAGVVHSHPVQRGNTEFSSADVGIATNLGVPSYIAAIQEKGGSKHVRYKPKPSHKGTSQPGEEFLAQLPIDVIVQHLNTRNPFVAALLQGASDGRTARR